MIYESASEGDHLPWKDVGKESTNLITHTLFMDQLYLQSPFTYQINWKQLHCNIVESLIFKLNTFSVVYIVDKMFSNG